MMAAAIPLFKSRAWAPHSVRTFQNTTRNGENGASDSESIPTRPALQSFSSNPIPKGSISKGSISTHSIPTHSDTFKIQNHIIYTIPSSPLDLNHQPNLSPSQYPQIPSLFHQNLQEMVEKRTKSILASFSHRPDLIFPATSWELVLILDSREIRARKDRDYFQTSLEVWMSWTSLSHPRPAEYR